jgi:ERCC4-related helicase
MMDDFQIAAHRWRFLEDPSGYIERETGGLQLTPLTRQFKTAKEILRRLVDGRGVLLADDVGLGKTTVGALVAWVVACQDMCVRIYAPNEVLRRRWAEELERHVPMLSEFGASKYRIKQETVAKLKAGSIQVGTHYDLIQCRAPNELRTMCDLMIIDEAHRAKGDGSAFNEALRNFSDCAKRKLILTATPFSIQPKELEQLLRFAGASKLDAVSRYAGELKRLFTLSEGHHVVEESSRLLAAAKAAITELQPYVIRHGIDDLSKAERRHFGEIARARWEIATPPASEEEIRLLLRMDRILQLAPERKGKRRNDPRFHIGWQHVATELDRASKRGNDDTDHAVFRHVKEASKSLRARRASPHPKVQAVSDAIEPLVDAGEKVLVFCHHRATASELLGALERTLKVQGRSPAGPPEKVWRTAWGIALSGRSRPTDDRLLAPIIDWFCSHGIRCQIAGWLGEPKFSGDALAEQLARRRPRGGSRRVPTILEGAVTLIEELLDTQSTSTRALLKNIARGQHAFGGQFSHFPGRLDDGLRVMGTWSHDGHGSPPKTLYTGKPDIVLSLFNSPFGPDVLVTTDRLSEGVDLHRCCRHLIHYELDPSPVRTLQRNGRVRRVGSWAALTGRPICYAYPTFGGTRDEKAVGIMRQRINSFGLLLGGVPPLDDESEGREQSFAEAVLGLASKKLKLLNRKLKV